MLSHLAISSADFNRKHPEKEIRPRSRKEAKLMLFDRLRVQSYPARPRFREWILWREHVLQLARIINREMGAALRDCDVVRIADRHAEWCFERLRHFVVYRHDSEIQAWKGTLSGKAHRFRVRSRDRLILELLARHPGTPFMVVARVCGISGTQVMRVVRRDAFEFYRSIRKRFRSRFDRPGWNASARMLRRWRRRFRELAKGKRGGRSHPVMVKHKKPIGSAPALAGTAVLAERQGFEPWRRVTAYTRSRRAPSTTRPPLPTASLLSILLQLQGPSNTRHCPPGCLGIRATGKVIRT